MRGTAGPGSAFCPRCGTPVAVTTATSTNGFETLMRESAAQQYWIKRLVALIIDAIIVGIVVAIIAAVLAIPAFLLSGAGALTFLFAGFFTVVAGIVLVLYFTLADVTAGATIGKRVLGLKVTKVGGGYPNIVEAFVRNISKIYWLLLLLDVVVGLAISKQYTQKYSDRLIGTEVVAQ